MLEKIKSFFTDDDNSKDIAKERLELVLVHDRMNMSRESLEEMKEDLIGVISKYVQIEENEFDIDLSQDDRMIAIKANIPVKKTTN
ncbi:MAG: cell division topological specificity factor MinE [Bacillota bacterium]